MSHGIATSRDFQIALEMAWHKLTRIAQPTRDGFPGITPVPLFYGDDCVPMKFGDNEYVVPLADDDKLPVAPPYCKGTYTLFTPREAWDWVSEVLAGTDFNIQSIGMLWNRSFWFMSVHLKELAAMSLGDGRESKFQLNFSGGLDRKVSPQCELSNIVAVCHNTISLSRATGTVLFRERATKNFGERLAAAKSEVEKAVGMAAVFAAAMKGLAERPCTKDEAREVFAGYMTPAGATEMSGRTKNAVDALADLHVTGKGNRGETEFDMLNALTQYVTHGTDDSKVPLGRRFASSEFGGGADTKADFTRVLTTERGARLPSIVQRGQTLLAK